MPSKEVKILFVDKVGKRWGIYNGPIEKHHEDLLVLELQGDWSRFNTCSEIEDPDLCLFFMDYYEPETWSAGDPLDDIDQWLESCPIREFEFRCKVDNLINEELRTFDYEFEHCHNATGSQTYIQHLKGTLEQRGSDGLDQAITRTIQRINSDFEIERSSRDSSPVRK